jgi:hypothetical protein
MWTSPNECLSLGLVSSALGNILALEVVSSSFTDSMSIMIRSRYLVKALPLPPAAGGGFSGTRRVLDYFDFFTRPE